MVLLRSNRCSENMKKRGTELPIREFSSSDELRAWLVKHHASSDGMWVRIYKKDSGVPSVTFEQVLDEGLCFGWSESLRRKGDQRSYLQRFTPRRTRGTTSKRNRERIDRLIKEERITRFGMKAL
jgi:uncharacterized protein YdeI (YjbR/CyaY-like superfamily)